MVYEVIKNFNKQFLFTPAVEGGSFDPSRYEEFILVGLGGSGLIGGLLTTWKESLPITVHRDYGLPLFPHTHRAKRCIVINSHSGNTEEDLEAFGAAMEKGFPVAVLASGGKLLELAKAAGVPHIVLPNHGIQPRMAQGFFMRAMLTLLQERDGLRETTELASRLQPQEFEDQGRLLAKKIKESVPVIYASRRNAAIAYNWKIKFNETSKIPSFWNVFPELNHNEMIGFDHVAKTEPLSERFFFLFLHDDEDHPRIQKRMEITRALFRDLGLPVEVVALRGASRFERIFSSLVLAEWTAYYTADFYGVDPEQVPMVERFKKLI